VWGCVGSGVGGGGGFFGSGTSHKKDSRERGHRVRVVDHVCGGTTKNREKKEEEGKGKLFG